MMIGLASRGKRGLEARGWPAVGTGEAAAARMVAAPAQVEGRAVVPATVFIVAHPAPCAGDCAWAVRAAIFSCYSKIVSVCVCRSVDLVERGCGGFDLRGCSVFVQGEEGGCGKEEK